MIQKQPQPSILKVDKIFLKYQYHFSQLNIPQITNCHEFGELYEYDNCFPDKLCQELIEITEKQGFKDAPITIGEGKALMDKSYRNSERVMFDDFETAQFLYQYMVQMAPLCSEGAYLESVNERFRFLKYDEGGIFKQHCDGRYYSSNRCMSMYTIHFYLNTVKKGGGTSFFYYKLNENKQFYDVKKTVESVTGKLAIFRQDGLYHQGDKVEKGLKYTVRNELMYKYLNNEEIQKLKIKQCNICKQKIQITPFKKCQHNYVKCGCPMFYSLNGQNNSIPECHVCKEEFYNKYHNKN